MKQMAVEALVRLHDWNSHKYLLSYLQTHGNKLQNQLEEAIIQSRDSEITQYLDAVLSSLEYDEASRVVAAKLLGKKDPATALPLIINTRTTCDPEQYNFISSLAQILAQQKNPMPKAETELLALVEAY